MHSASYEEFVLPSMDKDKIIPPPLPPKNTQSQPNSEPNGRYKLILYTNNQFLFYKYVSNIFICFKELPNLENYSVPGVMRRLESSP